MIASAAMVRKTNVVSIWMVVTWKIRLGNTAITAAATRPACGPASRRPTTKVSATVAVEMTIWNMPVSAMLSTSTNGTWFPTQ